MRAIPWWMRIAGKIVLSRLPVKYSFWKRLGLFDHGQMDRPEIAFQIYQTLAQTGGISIPHTTNNFNVLELGPGDSVFSAMIAKALGANGCWLIDAGAYATTNPESYKRMLSFLGERGYVVSINTQSIDAVLSSCNAYYLTDGIASFNKVENHTIDFIFSNAVLEHIPKKDFFMMALEMRRVLKPSGVCVHRVDLKDHLGGGLNNLRFSEEIWESHLFSRSGFYTNRIRYSQILEIFDQAGFMFDVTRKVCWDILPIDRKVLAAEFQKFTDEDLCVSGFDVVLRPKKV